MCRLLLLVDQQVRIDGMALDVNDRPMPQPPRAPSHSRTTHLHPPPHTPPPPPPPAPGSFYLHVAGHSVQPGNPLPGQANVTQAQFEDIAIAHMTEIWNNFGDLTEIW